MPYPVSSQLNSLDLCGLVLVASSTASETGDAWHMATQGLPAKDLQSAVSMRLGPGGAHGRLDQLRPVSFHIPHVSDHQQALRKQRFQHQRCSRSLGGLGTMKGQSNNTPGYAGQ